MSNLRLGTLIDRLYAQNQVVAHKKRLVARAETNVKREEAKATKIANEIQDRFSKETITGSEGKVGVVSLKTVTGAQLADWNKLRKFVIANNAVDLFQRRINKSAWLERLAARKNRPIPGIKTYQAVRLVVTKKRK